MSMGDLPIFWGPLWFLSSETWSSYHTDLSSLAKVSLRKFLCLLDLWQSSQINLVEKETTFSTNDAVSTGNHHVEDSNWSIPISLYKAQVQVDQELPHEIRYAESNRIESRKEPSTHWHRGKFSEQTPIAHALRLKFDK